MKIIALILCIVMLCALPCCTPLAHDDAEIVYVNSYEPLEENFVLDIKEPYHIYEPDELTAEVLEHRTEHDELIIERIIGKAARNGDGVVLNTADTEYNDISYKGTDLPYIDGTIILTYCIYSADNNYVDDVVDRFDFILDRQYED